MLIAIKRTFSFDRYSVHRGATIARLFSNKPQHTPNDAPLQKSKGIRSSQPTAFVPQFKSSFHPAPFPFERTQKGASEQIQPVYRFSTGPMTDMTLTGSDPNSSAGRSLQIRLTEQEERICEILDNVAKSYVQKGGKKVELRIAGGWVRDKVISPMSQKVDIAIQMVSQGSNSSPCRLSSSSLDSPAMIWILASIR